MAGRGALGSPDHLGVDLVGVWRLKGRRDVLGVADGGGTDSTKGGRAASVTMPI